MRCTVIWTPDAEQELAGVWLGASDRNAVTQASHTIDQRLERDPLNEGESRSNDRRILLVPPLGVIYCVHPEDQSVDVLHVWSY